jgi:hypothetical protein
VVALAVKFPGGVVRMAAADAATHTVLVRTDELAFVARRPPIRAVQWRGGNYFGKAATCIRYGTVRANFRDGSVVRHRVLAAPGCGGDLRGGVADGGRCAWARRRKR